MKKKKIDGSITLAFNKRESNDCCTQTPEWGNTARFHKSTTALMLNLIQYQSDTVIMSVLCSLHVA